MPFGFYLVLSLAVIVFFLFWWKSRPTPSGVPARDPYTQTLSYSYPVFYIRLSNGTEIAYVDEGSGDQILVFVHGLGSYLAVWRRNIEELKDHYRCIALDLPNYGKSQPGDYSFTVTFFSETVAAFIRELGLRRVVLIGHSMGGQIAMMTVLRKKVNIERVVLIASAGFEVFSRREKRWMLAFFKPEIITAASEEQIEQHLSMNFVGHRIPYDARFMVVDRLLMQEYPEYLKTYAKMIPLCTAGMLNEPLHDQLSQINIPAFIIYGKEDMLIPNRFLHPNLTPIQVAQSGRERIADSQLLLIPRAGHFVMWEQSEAVNLAIRQFLNRETKLDN